MTILLAAIFGLSTLGSLLVLIVGLGLLAEIGLGLAFWISTAYPAQIIVSFVGTIIAETLRSGRRGRVLPLVVGLIVYALLRATPILGFIVGLVVTLLGLGAVRNWIWRRPRRYPSQPPPMTFRDKLNTSKGTPPRESAEKLGALLTGVNTTVLPGADFGWTFFRGVPEPDAFYIRLIQR